MNRKKVLIVHGLCSFNICIFLSRCLKKKQLIDLNLLVRSNFYMICFTYMQIMLKLPIAIWTFVMTTILKFFTLLRRHALHGGALVETLASRKMNFLQLYENLGELERRTIIQPCLESGQTGHHLITISPQSNNYHQLCVKQGKRGRLLILIRSMAWTLLGVHRLLMNFEILLK